MAGANATIQRTLILKSRLLEAVYGSTINNLGDTISKDPSSMGYSNGAET